MLTAVASVASGHFVLHPPRSVPDRDPEGLGIAFERVTFRTADGIDVVAWWIPADDTPADDPTILFVHGYADSKAQVLPMLPWLHARANVLAPDLRAHGESGGNLTTAGHLEVQEVQAAAAWVRANRLPAAAPLTLFGWSMGGATAINAAPTVPGIEAVVTDSAFARLAQTRASAGGVAWLPAWAMSPIAYRVAAFEAGMGLDANEPVRELPRFAGPVLLIHGEDDSLVPVHQVEELLAVAPQAHVLRVPRAGHVEAFGTAPEAYRDAVTKFLDSAWSKDRTAPARAEA